jgi:hypothetical protein
LPFEPRSKKSTTKEEDMKRFATALILIALVPLALAAAGCSGSGDGEGGGDLSAPRSTEVDKVGGAPSGAGGREEPIDAPSEPDFSSPRVSDEAVAVSTATSPASVGPRIVKTAFLRLSVKEGRFEEVVERARLIAQGHGGHVTSSTASRGGEQRLVRGTLVLRVPENEYEAALRELGRVGTVVGREESGQDVSAQFVDLESRARHLQAVEAQLLELLEKTEDVPAALAVQSQLNAVQLELEQVRGQIRYLDDQSSYATISLDIRERGAAAATKSDGESWGIVEGWHDGARAFVRVVAGAFVVMATAAPLLLLIALALVGGRYALRRRGTSAMRAGSSADVG